MWVAIVIGAVLIVALVAVIILRRRGSGSCPVSIAILRRTSGPVPVDALVGFYERVFNQRPRVEPMPLPEGAGTATVLMAPPEHPAIGIFVVSHAYIEGDRAKATHGVEDRIAAEAIRTHVAYCSVDWMGSGLEGRRPLHGREHLRGVCGDHCGTPGTRRAALCCSAS